MSVWRRISVTLWLSLGTAAFAVTMFLVNLTHQRTPAILLWVAVPISVIIPTMASLRIIRDPDVHQATRRFWRMLAITCCLVVVATISHTYDGLTGATVADRTSGRTLSIYATCLVLVLYAFSRLPTANTGAQHTLRVTLDGGTVLIGAAVFLWHFQFRPMLEASGYRPTAVGFALLTLLLESMAIFIVARVALSHQDFVDRRALRLFGVGLAAGTLAGFLQLFLDETSMLNPSQIAIPLVLTCVSAGVQLQREWRPKVQARTPDVTQPFSVIPYLAIVAVDGLLIAQIVMHGKDTLIVALSAVALTGLVVYRQVSAFKENTRLVERLDHTSTHDALTGLPNRALFTTRLTEALSAERPTRRVTVALVDLDEFKRVNDTLGHSAGDALLIAVAQRLSAAVRPGDTVARLGGDEFVVIFDDVDPAEAEATAYRMLASLSEKIVADQHVLLAKASIGLASARTGEDPADVLRHADIAMYAAKHGGGSNYVTYRPGMASAVADATDLGEQLHRAIAQSELFLEYQPIVALDTGRLRGVEALVRWAHPARGTVAPSEFLPVAERTGLIVPLGDWVLTEAIRQYADWSAGPGSPGTVTVNVTAQQLADPHFADRVATALRAAGVDACCLILDIADAGAGDVPADTLEALRSTGVRINLDDFGAGTSSLSPLRDLQVDGLKLHGGLSADADGRLAAMPAALLALARAVDLEIAAEGVETEEQARRLAELGYQEAQGFHFARPMPPAAIADLIAHNNLAEGVVARL